VLFDSADAVVCVDFYTVERSLQIRIDVEPIFSGAILDGAQKFADLVSPVFHVELQGLLNDVIPGGQVDLIFELKNFKPDIKFNSDSLFFIKKSSSSDDAPWCKVSGGEFGVVPAGTGHRLRGLIKTDSFSYYCIAGWLVGCLFDTRWKLVFFACRVGTRTDPEKESQEIKQLFIDREDFDYDHEPRPEIRHFSNQIIRSTKPNSSNLILHFSGHGRADDDDSSSLYWAGEKKESNKVTGQSLVNLIQRNGGVNKIDCFFLNACCTLPIGRLLRDIGVKVVVCWENSVSDEVGHSFATRFYELVRGQPGQYAKAFDNAYEEQRETMSGMQPCLLQANRGSIGTSLAQIWDGCWDEEILSSPAEAASAAVLAPVPLPLVLAEGVAATVFALAPLPVVLTDAAAAAVFAPPLHPLVLLRPTTHPFEGGAAANHRIDKSLMCHDSEDDDEKEVIWKNWKSPKDECDFAAHAGRSEKEVLRVLNFNLMLNGNEIGHKLDSNCPPNGLYENGILTPDALKTIHGGVPSSFTSLWRRSGKVCQKASDVLRNSSPETRNQVRRAIQALKMSVFYRQLGILAFRYERRPTRESKLNLLSRGMEEIMDEFHRDCSDRKKISHGQVLESKR